MPTGEPVQGYGQYCPISRAVEVLGERWSLLIVRDMLCGATRFNDLARGLPGLSRSLLAKRLRQLEVAGIVERLDGEYAPPRPARTCARWCSASARGGRRGSSAILATTSSTRSC